MLPSLSLWGWYEWHPLALLIVTWRALVHLQLCSHRALLTGKLKLITTEIKADTFQFWDLVVTELRMGSSLTKKAIKDFSGAYRFQGSPAHNCISALDEYQQGKNPKYRHLDIYLCALVIIRCPKQTREYKMLVVKNASKATPAPLI